MALQEASMIIRGPLLILSSKQLLRSPSWASYLYCSSNNTSTVLKAKAGSYACSYNGKNNHDTRKCQLITSRKCKFDIHKRLITPLHFESPCTSRQVSWMLSMAPENQLSWRFSRMPQRTVTLSLTTRTHGRMKFLNWDRLRRWIRARTRSLPSRSWWYLGSFRITRRRRKDTLLGKSATSSRQFWFRHFPIRVIETIPYRVFEHSDLCSDLWVGGEPVLHSGWHW